MIRGYVTSRAFGGLIVPVPAQNTALREFARNKSQVYVLPFLEHKFAGCYMQLFTVLKTAQPGDYVAMYSASMLPIEDSRKLSLVEDEIRKRDCLIHCVLEGITTKSIKGLENIIMSYRLRQYLDKCLFADLSEMRSNVK